jgi:hypothetical protein
VTILSTTLGGSASRPVQDLPRERLDQPVEQTAEFPAQLLKAASGFLEVIPEAIPAELRALGWVLWRATPDPEKPEKPKKVPYRVADPTRTASPTDPATWAPFMDAVEAYTLLAGRYRDPDPRKGPLAGLGCVLTAEAGIVCLDLDQVLDGATLDPRAARIVDGLRSWTEISPSGRGLHIFVRGGLAEAIKSPQIEVYATTRYIAVTGHAWPGMPPTLRNAQAYLDALAQVARPAARGTYTGPTVPPPDDLAGALLAKLARWGVEHGPVKRWQDGYLVELRRCPWSDQHTTGAGGAAVMIFASGAYDFTCLHAHCGSRGWQDFRALVDR